MQLHVWVWDSSPTSAPIFLRLTAGVGATCNPDPLSLHDPQRSPAHRPGEGASSATQTKTPDDRHRTSTFGVTPTTLARVARVSGPGTIRNRPRSGHCVSISYNSTGSDGDSQFIRLVTRQLNGNTARQRQPSRSKPSLRPRSSGRLGGGRRLGLTKRRHAGDQRGTDPHL